MYMLGLFNAGVQMAVSNEKQQNGVTTDLEEVGMVCINVMCHHSPGGSEEN